MGWWGYDIMEGDDPLDCQGEILDFLADPELVKQYQNSAGGSDELYDMIHNSGYDALKIEEKVRSAFDAIAGDRIYTADGIGLQVLGEMIMCSGGVFLADIREACIASANEELNADDDGWRLEGERSKCLLAYIKRVGEYVDGVAYEPTSQGLLAAICTASESGLINK
jgi:hypothetical protein